MDSLSGTAAVVSAAGIRTDVSELPPRRGDPDPESPYARLRPGNFRLLQVHPASSRNNALRVTIREFQIEDAVNYEALSYEWGDSTAVESLEVNTYIMKFSKNLWEALLQLRGRPGHRLIWVDAICINQLDTHERSLQVRMMHQIYSRAQRVIVWLGTEVAHQPSRIVTNIEIDWTKVLSSAWFRRLGAVQEYALAKAVIFLWGSRTFTREILQNHVNAKLDRLGLINQKGVTREGNQGEKACLQGFRYLEFVKQAVESRSLDEVDFGQILVTDRELEATDPRDYIYASLALAPASLREFFKVNYRVSLDETYLELSRAISLESRVEAEIDLIRRLYLTDQDSITPDWLPEWADDLGLRASSFLQQELAPLQPVVIECLDLLAARRQWHQEIHLSASDKSNYSLSLHNTSIILRSLLSRATLATEQGPASATEIITPNAVEADFSDSGYSSASSTIEETSLVADEIAAHLLSHTYLHRLLNAAKETESQPMVLEHKLRPCIRNLGRDLDSLASDFEELLAARELKRHAQYITRALVVRLRSVSGREYEEIVMQRRSRIAELLERQTLRKDRTVTKDMMPSSQVPEIAGPAIDSRRELQNESPLQSGVLQQDLAKSALGKVKEFIHSEAAYLPFLASIERLAYSSPFESIESEIKNWIKQKVQSSIFPSISQLLSFNLITTLSIEIFREESLKHHLTVSGSPQLSYASSCEAYLTQTWPNTGGDFFKTISSNVNLEVDGKRVSNPPSVGGNSELHIVEWTEKMVIFRVTMQDLDESFLRDTAQQIAWLTAAHRLHEAKWVHLSEVLAFVSDDDTFRVSSLPLTEVEDREACWVPLLPGSVIAYGWPIPARSGENGLELPFHLMASIAGPLYPMKFGLGFCMKAHSRILFPTATNNRRSGSVEPLHVQWHFECKADGQLAPPWHRGTNEYWNHITSLHVRDIVEARTFLGYCRAAVVDLGTEKTADYHNRILYSGLDDEEHAAAIGMPNVISLGTGTLSPVKVDAMFPISRSKARILAADLERDYTDVVYEAAERPVILYDSNGSDRAWMVPLSCVLLHMIHTWSAKRAPLTANLPSIKLTPNAGIEARNILLERWEFVVRKTINVKLHDDKLVRDLVMQFWKNICEKQFEDLQARTQTDPSVEFQPEKLYGWDYMSVVDDGPSRRKQTNFNANWGAFREECVVLCGKNLGDVIKPGDGIKVCEKWDPIRSKRMYLTATMRCLNTLSYQHGGEREIFTNFRLTNKGYWHYKPKELFLDCEDCDRKTCRKKVQHLHSSPPATNTLSLIPPSDGAVVFGRRLLERLQPPIEPAENSSSGSRSRRLNFLTRATGRIRDRLERVTSGSATTMTTTTFSNDPSEEVLSDEDMSDYA